LVTSIGLERSRGVPDEVMTGGGGDSCSMMTCTSLIGCVEGTLSSEVEISLPSP
jgi:hypothetical protein